MTIFILSPTTTTVPVRMLNYIQESIDPLLCAVSAFLALMTAILMLVLYGILGI